MTHPVLKVADPEQPFILQTDASKVGFGAVLSQEDENGEEHPVTYASQKLVPWERNYSVLEKECLAVVWALSYFNVYLKGQNVTVQTDHQPLAWLLKMKNANQRLIRWTLALQPYRLTLRHRKGSDNENTDGLSRGPCVLSDN